MNTNLSSEVQRRLERIRWWVMNKDPFYRHLVVELQDAPAPPGVAVAATDGEHLFWNPEACCQLTDEEMRFVLLHEVEHCGRGHFWRFKPGLLENAACDFVINLALSQMEGVRMPKGGLLSRKYLGLAEEEVLKLLEKEPEPHYSNFGAFLSPSEGKGEKSKGEPLSGEEKSVEDLKKKWERAVIRAGLAAGPGNIPGSWQAVIERLTAHPQPDWRAVTADFIRQHATSLLADWTRAARRHAWRGIIDVPRRKQNSLSKVVIIRDTSGSISNETLAVFNNLIEGCISELQVSALVLDSDTRVAAEYELSPGDLMPSLAPGRGGTDFRSAFERAEKEEASGIIVFTDLDATFPKECPFPTLWVVQGKGHKTPPFGRVVKVQ